MVTIAETIAGGWVVELNVDVIADFKFLESDGVGGVWVE
jgi:hypothetical protein